MRLIIKDRIAVTSEDDGYPFGLRELVAAGSRVLSITVCLTVEAVSIYAGDLIIDFDGQAHLLFLQLPSGYESWALSI